MAAASACGFSDATTRPVTPSWTSSGSIAIAVTTGQAARERLEQDDPQAVAIAVGGDRHGRQNTEHRSYASATAPATAAREVHAALDADARAASARSSSSSGPSPITSSR